MDEHEVIRTIESRPRKIARRRLTCPSSARVAAYLEQRLDLKERSRFEAHLSDCDFCLDTIGGLVRQQRNPELSEAPAHLIDQAANTLPTQTRWQVSRRWVLVPACITVVIAAVVLLLTPQSERSLASLSTPAIEKSRPAVALLQPPSQSPEEQYVRKLSPVQMVEVLEPLPQSVVLRGRLRFRWKAVANATYYELRVVNAEGDVLWQGQESNPTTQLPPNLPVRSGAYFVWVRAFLNDGRTIKSDPVPFTISK